MRVSFQQAIECVVACSRRHARTIFRLETLRGDLIDLARFQWQINEDRLPISRDRTYCRHIIGYVLEGSSYLRDENEERVDLQPGDRLNLPKGSWHAEGEATDRVVWIVTVNEPVPFIQALMPIAAKGPMPDFGLKSD